MSPKPRSPRTFIFGSDTFKVSVNVPKVNGKIVWILIDESASFEVASRLLPELIRKYPRFLTTPCWSEDVTGQHMPQSTVLFGMATSEVRIHDNRHCGQEENVR